MRGASYSVFGWQGILIIGYGGIIVKNRDVPGGEHRTGSVAESEAVSGSGSIAPPQLPRFQG